MSKYKKKPARVLEHSSRQGGKNNGQAINPARIIPRFREKFKLCCIFACNFLPIFYAK